MTLLGGKPKSGLTLITYQTYSGGPVSFCRRPGQLVLGLLLHRDIFFRNALLDKCIRKSQAQEMFNY